MSWPFCWRKLKFLLKDAISTRSRTRQAPIASHASSRNPFLPFEDQYSSSCEAARS